MKNIFTRGSFVKNVFPDFKRIVFAASYQYITVVTGRTPPIQIF